MKSKKRVIFTERPLPCTVDEPAGHQSPVTSHQSPTLRPDHIRRKVTLTSLGVMHLHPSKCSITATTLTYLRNGHNASFRASSTYGSRPTVGRIQCRGYMAPTPNQLLLSQSLKGRYFTPIYTPPRALPQ